MSWLKDIFYSSKKSIHPTCCPINNLNSSEDCIINECFSLTVCHFWSYPKWIRIFAFNFHSTLFSSHCNKTVNNIYLSKYIILDLTKSFSLSTVSTEQFVEILQQHIYSILFYSTNQPVWVFTTLILMSGYKGNILLSHAHFLASDYMAKTLTMGFLDMFCIAVSLFTQEKRIELYLKQRSFFCKKKYIH